MQTTCQRTPGAPSQPIRAQPSVHQRSLPGHPRLSLGTHVCPWAPTLTPWAPTSAQHGKSSQVFAQCTKGCLHRCLHSALRVRSTRMRMHYEDRWCGDSAAAQAACPLPHLLNPRLRAYLFFYLFILAIIQLLVHLLLIYVMLPSSPLTHLVKHWSNNTGAAPCAGLGPGTC